MRKGEIHWSVVLGLVLGVITLAIIVLAVLRGNEAPNETQNRAACESEFRLWCSQAYILKTGPADWTGEGKQNCVPTSSSSELCQKCKEVNPAISDDAC